MKRHDQEGRQTISRTSSEDIGIYKKEKRGQENSTEKIRQIVGPSSRGGEVSDESHSRWSGEILRRCPAYHPDSVTRGMSHLIFPSLYEKSSQYNFHHIWSLHTILQNIILHVICTKSSKHSRYGDSSEKQTSSSIKVSFLQGESLQSGDSIHKPSIFQNSLSDSMLM